MFGPIYRSERVGPVPVPDVVAERRRYLAGYAVAALHAPSLAEQALAKLPPADVDIEIRGTADPRPLFAHHSGDAGERLDLTYDEAIVVGGRRLLVRCTAREGYVAAVGTHAPLAFALGLLLATGALVGYILLMTSQSRRTERLVAVRAASMNR